MNHSISAADALAETLAHRCERPRQTGTGWQACCPAHEDHTPSLSITPTADKVLLHCHAGCTPEAIVAALGLAMRDLFVTAPSPPAPGQPHIVTTYPYHDADGQLVFEVVRYAPKAFRQRRPDPAQPGAWIWNLRGVTRVLYHLPDVLQAVAAGAPVYVCEGEKDTENVRALGLTATCNPGGAGKWARGYTATLTGAHVVLLPDNDPAGRHHTAVVTRALAGAAATMTVLELPGLPAQGDVSDWLQAGGTRAQLEALAAAAPAWAPPVPAAPAASAPPAPTADAPWPDPPGPERRCDDPRPVIRIDTDISKVVTQGQEALLHLPHAPIVYQRARRLCIIARGVRPPKWLHRSPDAPVILEASPAHLGELAAQAAQWERYDERQHAWVPARPPRWSIEALQGRPAWPFPPLEGLVCSPTLRPDGSVLDTPGYDPDTGLFLDTNGTAYPPLPARPTRDEARAALGQLQEVVQDFPFTAAWHFSAWVSAVLSLVCRYTIPGCVPLHGITATTRGSGKSLLADTIAMIGTGRPAARWPQAIEEEEERKRLLTLALDGDPVIVIDNVTAPFGSGALALALTASSFKDRVLGKNQTKEAPMSAVFLCTGNNVQYVGDMARRVVPIALDPQMEKPEEREHFQHTPLLPWLQRARPRVVVAALTMVRAYFEAGCPAQGVKPLGSFEPWSTLIRQTLVWAGEADPCEGRKDIEATNNPEYEALDGLLHAWHACYSTKAVTLKHVVQDIGLRAASPPGQTTTEWHDLQDAISAFDARYEGKGLNTRAIGDAFRRIEGRIIDGLRLVRAGTYKHAVQWCIQVVR